MPKVLRTAFYVPIQEKEEVTAQAKARKRKSQGFGPSNTEDSVLRLDLAAGMGVQVRQTRASHR